MTNFLLVYGYVQLGLLIWLVHYRRQLHVFHPAAHYLAFHALVFVVRPSLVVWRDYDFMYAFFRVRSDEFAVIEPLLVANLACLIFVGMCLRIGNAPLAFKRIDFTTSKTCLKAMFWTALVLGPAAFYVQIGRALNRANDGFTTMSMDLATGIVVHTDTVGYVTDLYRMLAPLTVLLAWHYRFRPVSLIPFLTFVSLAAASGGGRFSFLLAIIAMMIAYLYTKERGLPSALQVIVGGAAVAVFALIGEQRELIVNLISNEPLRKELFASRFLEGPDFAMFESLQYIMRAVPEKTGTYDYFIANLQIFTEPLPRILWPEKPIGAPVQLFNLNHYGNFIGIVYSMPGVGWLSLGYVGVVIWSAIWGGAFGAYYRWAMQPNRSAIAVATYILFLSLAVNLFRDGVLVSVLKFSMWTFIVAGVWAAFHKLFAYGEGSHRAELSPRQSPSRARVEAMRGAMPGGITGGADNQGSAR